MKIAVDVTTVEQSGPSGAAVRFLLDLLTGFARYASSEQFILMTSPATHELFKQFEPLGMQRRCMETASNAAVAENLRQRISRFLRRLLPCDKSESADASLLFCPLTASTALRTALPVVSVVHDLMHAVHPCYLEPHERAQRETQFARFEQRVAFTVCSSPYGKADMIDKLHIPADRVAVINHSPRFQSSAVQSAADIAAGPSSISKLFGKRYLFCPAEMRYEHNHTMLLIAFNMLVHGAPDCDLHLVLSDFDPLSAPLLQDAVCRMELADRVHLLGELLEPERETVWRNAYALIYPVLFAGVAFPLLEAMHYRKPILASGITSIPEIARDAGIFFDPRKPEEIVAAIMNLYGDDCLYAELVARGAENLKRFSFDRMVEEYLQVFHHVAAAA